MLRLAIIISHPIQYYVPMYERLAKQNDVQLKVFFTWHMGQKAVLDRGFKKEVVWDIPLTAGYDTELVPNVASDPGTHHFWGLRNPTLIEAVLRWDPAAVFLTGYNYASHLNALYSLYRRKVPVLCRGDSHLLDQQGGFRWLLKRAALSRIYRWPAACLYVGTHNKDYYRAFRVPERKLFPCRHSIEVDRFSEPHNELEEQAAAWRKELGIEEGKLVLVFAGKFEDKKRPAELMKAVRATGDSNLKLIMVGDGELGIEVRRIAESEPNCFRVLPFQNQSRMPLVYRLGDLFILPSAYNETWGLAVNEALACGRPVLVSDKVGCAPDLIKPGINGAIFAADNWQEFRSRLSDLIRNPANLRTMGQQARLHAAMFDVPHGVEFLLTAVREIVNRSHTRCLVP